MCPPVSQSLCPVLIRMEAVCCEQEEKKRVLSDHKRQQSVHPGWVMLASQKIHPVDAHENVGERFSSAHSTQAESDKLFL